ncbi:PLP-dependent aminotransferase family protein [Streptomyces sp. NBC_00878]|uniref:MocR-like pyridoxine biosynthesis transcription factor PdxR n=1 Tax=Streptomyces sp. NBC_00878 TaxID=2975854 RepID=UPI002252F696|nr:PLP-dependent aminotransferase family protein [Streptomyces sp. NBC_00878]MCX4904644.1 PLP-dependent aminotransferase family protein [Streptomyces sp. NBC_00878]
MAAALVASIARQELKEGEELPSTRVLARQLGYSRSVVVSAYEELVASGFLTARAGSSTRVAVGAKQAAALDARQEEVAARDIVINSLATGSDPTPDTRLSESASLDLLPGYPDTELIDALDWRRAFKAASQQALWDRAISHQPGDVRVHRFLPDLQEQVAEHIRTRRHLLCDPQDVFFFPSVTSALRTLTSVLDLRGRTVAMEDPGYRSARTALTNAGACIHGVAVDADGIRVDQIPPEAAATYVTPAHQFPLGSRLSVTRRAQLLSWAAAHGGYVFEDDYDGEFRYDLPPMPPLRAMSTGERHVIYLGTASKILTRDLRVAWAVTPPHLRGPIQQALLDDGDSVSALSAWALTELLRSGAVTRHTVRAMRTYRARRDRFTRAVQELLPDVRLLGINAGLHTVLAWDQVDEAQLVSRLAARGVACAPLSQYWSSALAPRHVQGLVCGYARLRETHAMPVVRLIGEEVRTHQG